MESEFNIAVTFCFATALFCVQPSAIISFHNRRWRWHLSLANFEAVHGMSRVVRLLPDKIATAQTIAAEFKPEDSLFLIELVIKLTKLFEVQAREKQLPLENNSRETLIIPVAGHEVSEVDSENGLSFYHCVKIFREELEGLIEDIKAEEPLVERVQRILDLADGIQASANVFLNYIHPCIINCARQLNPNSQRHDCFQLLNNELTETVQTQIIEKCSGLLKAEYDALM